jgi:hypothetical protein
MNGCKLYKRNGVLKHVTKPMNIENISTISQDSKGQILYDSINIGYLVDRRILGTE